MGWSLTSMLVRRQFENIRDLPPDDGIPKLCANSCRVEGVRMIWPLWGAGQAGGRHRGALS